MNRGLKRVFLLYVFLFNSSCVFASPVSVDVNVVDQKGNPVEKAQVYARYRYPAKDDVHESITDDNGRASFLDSSPIWIGVTVKKQGYYRSVVEVEGNEGSQVTVGLREKRNPIPMYVNKVMLHFPAKGEEIGFDLSDSDWVAPYGEGERAHIYFRLDGENRGLFDGHGKLTVSFPHQKGGIKYARMEPVASDFRFPYNAPKSGYDNQIVHRYKEIPEDESQSHVETETLNQNALGYFFKSVMRVNEDGDPAEKQYGKILGEFKFSVVENKKEESEGYVKFTYYLNPNPNSRNIEFDPRRNLFDDVDKTFPP